MLFMSMSHLLSMDKHETPALDNRTLYYVISTIEPMSSVEIIFQVRIIE